MTYVGIQKHNEAELHLGGNILEGAPQTFDTNVWNYIIDRFAIKSVLDLGSGLGYSSSYFFEKGMKVIAVDGLYENIERALYPTIQIDLIKDYVNCKVDLVHCQKW